MASALTALRHTVFFCDLVTLAKSMDSVRHVEFDRSASLFSSLGHGRGESARGASLAEVVTERVLFGLDGLG
jgi:hypothetical protein